ncbi:MAG TPA: TIGR02117 family protein [Bacteroidia bacterium]|jgi:uncharacterized protein (TIGR02117 family)|nr:TIGR02117 family protein [Bacteroidia bacterium]
MNTHFRKLFRFLIILISSVISFVFLYTAAVVILSGLPSRIPRIMEPKQPDEVDIFILSNGVHTDLVLPATTNQMDWKKRLTENSTCLDSAVKWIAFGWGDKGFYLETPTWNDLKWSTAGKAAFALGGTAMHVSTYKSLTENDHCKKISISNENYAKLIEYIDSSFYKNKDSSYVGIPNQHYNETDAFYEANGSYSLFKTCNTWTNDGLKVTGAKACLWTVIDKGIFWHY